MLNTINQNTHVRNDSLETKLKLLLLVYLGLGGVGTAMDLRHGISQFGGIPEVALGFGILLGLYALWDIRKERLSKQTAMNCYNQLYALEGVQQAPTPVSAHVQLSLLAAPARRIPEASLEEYKRLDSAP